MRSLKKLFSKRLIPKRFRRKSKTADEQPPYTFPRDFLPPHSPIRMHDDETQLAANARFPAHWSAPANAFNRPAPSPANGMPRLESPESQPKPDISGVSNTYPNERRRPNVSYQTRSQQETYSLQGLSSVYSKEPERSRRYGVDLPRAGGMSTPR